MNEAAREALRAAALKGTRQIYGLRTDRDGGRCAVGVLDDAHVPTEDLRKRSVVGCHLCGALTTWTGIMGRHSLPITHEQNLLVHLNNDHKLDFIGIAEKMPQEAV